MKTKNLFKNLLSLLAIVLVVFSCTKPSEEAKLGEKAKTDVAAKPLELEITSVKFEKAKNFKDTDVSEFYEKLFITKTPARDKSKTAVVASNGYPDKFETEATDIKGNNIFINLPYNSNFEKLTANATIKAVLTFKSAVDSVVLEAPKTNIRGNSAEISFEINKDHFTSENLKSANPVIKQVLKFSKAGFADKIYTVNFKFSESKSDSCTIEETGFKFKVGGTTGINKSGDFNSSKTVDGIVTANYVASNTDTPNSGTNPIEFKLRKGSSNNELKEAGVADTDYFKADALELPDGAFIEVSTDTTACPGTGSTPTCANVNPITGMKGTGVAAATGQTHLIGKSDNGAISYTFTVVAQNGTSKKYYKLTINATS
ncbi:hypothetical protein [Ichthyobacterium seriolicida]|uniref:Lipoprotein n=1 Tax=Ichthyobacterium seriolicida TaxID=242600 RepID=A0A1J1DWB3_9FLAO|nr:hypothetical protein [Ichthyobacterium seriolicida]BAV94153.1 hypothetical protein JBKA6_0140 [Ichthyobacterium seriolicida]